MKFPRLSALFDKSGWGLAALGLLVTLLLAGGTIIPIVRATGAAVLIASLVIFGSRIFWPQVSMAEAMVEIKKGNTAFGIVVAGLMIFCGMAFIGIIMVMK